MSRLGLGVAIALATFGCAQEREPISRVQPNALQKSFFVGQDLQGTADDPEFWYRGTVVDTGYGAQQDGLFTSTYAMPVSRIKWEISETMLVARLSYERIQDSDGKVGTEKGKEGQIVAAFPIQSHFDIRRSYNPVTGEEQNVVEENAIDRPWNEREYIRVDWSRNMVTNSYDFDTLSMIGVYGGVSYEPMQYYVNDPTSPDAPVFDDGYFDITQKVYATPQVLNFSDHLASLFGVSSFPACMLDADIGGGTAPVGNCNPHELKLRLSFRKVADTDYEAQDWDGVRFQAFGAFTLNFNGRMGYTRPYGIVDDKTHRFIERYNIWQKSHYYDNAGNPVVCGTVETEAASLADDDGNGTVNACEAVTAATGLTGSRCDVYAKKCTLPFRARQDRSIVWYYHDGPTDEFQKTAGTNKNFDSTDGDAKAGLFEPTDWATTEWDVAMRSARTAARLTECKKSGDAAACEQQFPHWHGQMDDQEDAIRLTREVLLCRRANKAWNTTSCDAVADQKAAAWGISDPGVIAIAKQKEAVILCHNPVIDSDHPDCHAPFKTGQEKRVRLGDLRFNAVNTINTPQVPSAWGIMVDAKDPLTGETIAASINIWNHVTDLASQGAIDLIRYINGDLSTQEITDGTFIKDWVLANEGLAGGSRTTPPMNKEEVLQRLSATLDSKDPKSMEKLRASFENYIQGKPVEGELAKSVQSLKKVNRDLRASSDPKDSVRAPLLQQRIARARGTELEAALINKPALEAAGINPNDAGQLDSTSIDRVSPLRMGNSLVVSRILRARQNALAERGACLIEATPEFSGIIGLAHIMNEKFPALDGESKAARGERMRKHFARRMHYGVIIHEMGHSFGERHNFVSSFDALNFRPQYWQLRARNGQVSTACTDAFVHDGNGNIVKDASGNPQTHDGTNCVGPRYFDPITNEEQENLLWMWQQSSVMDYPGDITVDTLGLGGYDFAAARMFYGETTSVFSNDGSRGSNVNIKWSTDSDSDGFPDAFETTFGSDPNDAGSTPNRFGNPDDNGNKIPDAVEALFAGDIRVTDSTTDSDKDGVPDSYERLLGTNPNDDTTAGKNDSVKIASDLMRYRALLPDAQMSRDFLDRMDQFGGILGLRTGDSHYSLHQAKYNVVQMDKCADVDPQALRPSDWNDAVDGAFHNVLDARVVGVDGAFKRCRQQTVDYVNWSDLQTASSQTDEQTVTGDNPPALDTQGRVRVPYAFASDNWADLGNVSVYRHDQGADVYEQFMFLMGSQENRHILDHYRRNRTTFAIRPAMNRDFSRYTEKIMHAVKGLGLYRNLYTTDYVGGVWDFAAGGFLADNVLAASLAMDHFSRQLTRPQSGEHYLFGDLIDTSVKPILRSAEDTFIVGPQLFQTDDDEAFAALEFASTEAETNAALDAAKNARSDNPVRIVIPNGSAGYLSNGFATTGFGGRPINNDLDRTKGDYSSSYQLTVGSYYEKVNAIMALTESQDNFISSSRTDFVDARYRATSVADVFPQGFRRLIGAALSDDVETLGPRVAGRVSTLPVTNFYTDKQIERFPKLAELSTKKDRCEDPKSDCVLGEDGQPYPKQPMAWTSWWPAEGPSSCWSTNGTQLCAQLTSDEQGAPVVSGNAFEQLVPKFTLTVDPEVGWEVQKHIIAWIYAYLPENNRLDWFDMMRIYRSYDIPEFQGAVVKWRDPFTGTLYAARSYGKETINGKEVEIGIAARVLAHCNELTNKAFQVEATDPDTGELTLLLENGLPVTKKVNIGSGVVTDLPVVDSLKRYKSVPELMWQAGMSYGIYTGGLKGVY